MKYQKIINFWYSTTTQPSKFKTEKWVQINDDTREIYNACNQTKFKTRTLKSSLINYSNLCIVFKGNISVTGATADHAVRLANKGNKHKISKNVSRLLIV